MLGTLIFTGSELWAPFNLPYRTALKGLEVYPSVCYQSDHQRNVCKWSLNFLFSDLMITAIKREQAFRCTSLTITIKVMSKSTRYVSIPINSTYPTICRLIHIPFYLTCIWNKIPHAPISQGSWIVHRGWEDCCHTTTTKTILVLYFLIISSCCNSTHSESKLKNRHA